MFSTSSLRFQALPSGTERPFANEGRPSPDASFCVAPTPLALQGGGCRRSEDLSGSKLGRPLRESLRLSGVALGRQRHASVQVVNEIGKYGRSRQRRTLREPTQTSQSFIRRHRVRPRPGQPSRLDRGPSSNAARSWMADQGVAGDPVIGRGTL